MLLRVLLIRGELYARSFIGLNLYVLTLLIHQLPMLEDAPAGHGNQEESGGDQQSAGRELTQRVQNEAQHCIEKKNIAVPDQIRVHHAKEHEPQHAAVMNVRSVGSSPSAGEPIDQEVHAGAEGQRENG